LLNPCGIDRIVGFPVFIAHHAAVIGHAFEHGVHIVVELGQIPGLRAVDHEQNR
jgi:hypothetical protein